MSRGEGKTIERRAAATTRAHARASRRAASRARIRVAALLTGSNARGADFEGVGPHAHRQTEAVVRHVVEAVHASERHRQRVEVETEDQLGEDPVTDATDATDVTGVTRA